MKSTSTLGLSLGMALLCGNQTLSQTNQQLLQDGLISPMVFELLERQGAKTPKELLIKRRLGIVLAIKKTPTTRSVMRWFWVVLHRLQGEAEPAPSELNHLRFNP